MSEVKAIFSRRRPKPKPILDLCLNVKQICCLWPPPLLQQRCESHPLSCQIQILPINQTQIQWINLHLSRLNYIKWSRREQILRGSLRKKKTIFVVIVQISLTSYPPYPNLDTKIVDNVTVIYNPPFHKKFGQNLSDLFWHITVESH